MEEFNSASSPKTGPSVPAIPSVERRRFLRHLGLFTASTAAFLSACQNSANELAPTAASGARVAFAGNKNFGTGDVAILNYAYALEQLETAFYDMAVMKMFPGARPGDMDALVSIRDHELIHREFFKAAIPDAARIDDNLEFDFSKVDFSVRQEVLNTARQLEDVGVAAYNGAGPLLSKTDAGKTYLLLAGKIVSVEARHTSLISLLLSPDTDLFAGYHVVKKDGLDISMKPAEVLPIALRYIKTTGLDASGLLSLNA